MLKSLKNNFKIFAYLPLLASFCLNIKFAHHNKNLIVFFILFLVLISSVIASYNYKNFNSLGFVIIGLFICFGTYFYFDVVILMQTSNIILSLVCFAHLISCKTSGIK